jgi:hypothetical protein
LKLFFTSASGTWTWCRWPSIKEMTSGFWDSRAISKLSKSTSGSVLLSFITCSRSERVLYLLHFRTYMTPNKCVTWCYFRCSNCSAWECNCQKCWRKHLREPKEINTFGQEENTVTKIEFMSQVLMHLLNSGLYCF